MEGFSERANFMLGDSRCGFSPKILACAVDVAPPGTGSSSGQLNTGGVLCEKFWECLGCLLYTSDAADE